MSARIIVCATSQGAIGALFEHGKLQPCRNYPATAEGQRAFAELLHAHPAAPVYLMVDSVEEDYHSDLLPHVSGHARSELLQRKLKQIYRNTFYYTAWIQGRDSDKRRDDRYLFAALTNTELLRPWQEVLNSLPNPLAGVYLLPMVSQELVARLKVAETNLLLVSLHKGGLRQSFFQGGQLKTSRLAVADVESGGAALLAAEIGKTRLYLGSLRLVPRDAKLAVLLLDTNGDLAALQQCLQADASFTCARLTQHELGDRLGGAMQGSCHYALHMLVLGMHPPANNIAPANATRSYQRYRQQRMLHGASLVVAAVAAIWAGGDLYQRSRLNDEARQLEMQTREQQARYAAVTKIFPQAPASAESLEKAVQLADRIKDDRRTPEKMMMAVSRVLESSPEVMLMRLSWKIDAAKRDAGRPGAGGAAGNGWQEEGVMEGEIKPFRGDYRAAMTSVNRLVEKLRNDPDIGSVNVVQMPLNIHSTSALSGNTLDTVSADAVRAEFTLKLVLKGHS